MVKINSVINNASEIILGLMRINKLNIEEAEHIVLYSYENGVNYYDNADIYADGRCEELFGQVLDRHKDIRDKIIVQSKCGIVHNDKGHNVAFDFSYDHIIKSVDTSLLRMKTDYLDVLLLHRPDALMEPCEVARAFDDLEKSGKVRSFGVSNQNPYQTELLKTCVKQELKINQVQLSITDCGMIAQGLNTNMSNKPSYVHDGGIYEYSRLNDITIQAWSPIQYGFFEGVFLNDPKFEELNKTLQKYAEKYNVEKSAIAFAWILRLPAKTQVITGSTYVKHLEDLFKAREVKLTREEWYDIYMSAGHSLP